MYDRSQMHKMLRNFRFSEVQRLTAEDISTQADETWRRLLEDLERSSALILRREDLRKEQLRDAFAAELENWVGATATNQTKSRLQQIIRDGEVIESGYRMILDSVRNMSLSGQDDEVQIWAIFHRLQREFSFIEEKIQSNLTQSATHFDPTFQTITDIDGFEFQPDAMISRLVDLASSALAMLCFEKDLFDRDGLARLPAAVSISDDVVYQCGSLFALGSAWSNWEKCEERARYFGLKIERTQIEIGANGEQAGLVSAISFADDPDEVPWDLIMDERRARQAEQWLYAFSRVDVSGKVKNPLDVSTLLLPDEFASTLEPHAAYAISEELQILIPQHRSKYEGLELRELLRGYVVLQLLAERAPQECVIHLSKAQLIEKLTSAGLSQDAALAFLAIATFGKGNLDLYDGPLIQCSDETYHLIATPIRSAALARVVISRLSSLRVQIRQRGPAFEERAKALFSAKGIISGGAKFTRHSEEYQFDICVSWGSILFVFECKNTTLRVGSPQATYFFTQDRKAHAKQVQRLARAAEAHSDEVRKQLNTDAQWTQIVPCVLYSCPFACGEDDGVFFYDFSSLTRFFESPSLTLRNTSNEMFAVDVPGTRLWAAAERPTPDDLLKQLQLPMQTAVIGSQFFKEQYAFALKPGHVGLAYRWRRRSSSIEDIAEAARRYGDHLQEA